LCIEREISVSAKTLNGLVITEELREELEQAAVATQQAYNAVRSAPGKVKKNVCI